MLSSEYNPTFRAPQTLSEALQFLDIVGQLDESSLEKDKPVKLYCSSFAMEAKSHWIAVYMLLRENHCFNLIASVGSSLTGLSGSTATFWRTVLQGGDPIWVPRSSVMLSSSSISWAAGGMAAYTPSGYSHSSSHRIEDLCLPPIEIKLSNGCTAVVFGVLDGHGGRECAIFFADRVPSYIESVLSTHLSHNDTNRIPFPSTTVQTHLKSSLIAGLQKLDQEFCDIRIRQLKAMHVPDDGSTMSLVVVVDGWWMVSLHIGDSRTIVMNETRLTFCSKDHSVARLDKARVIQRAGGCFGYRKKKHGKPSEVVEIVPDLTKAYPNEFVACLQHSRVYRPQGFKTKMSGINRTKNMNMSDALGDVVMKNDPPLFECVPDVSFVNLVESEYHILVATDGLWGALDKTLTSEASQCESIAKRLSELMSNGGKKRQILPVRLPQSTTNAFIPNSDNRMEDKRLTRSIVNFKAIGTNADLRRICDEIVVSRRIENDYADDIGMVLVRLTNPQ